MRISDWSSDVCSSDLMFPAIWPLPTEGWIVAAAAGIGVIVGLLAALLFSLLYRVEDLFHRLPVHWMWWPAIGAVVVGVGGLIDRSEEHTSELQSLMRKSYAVFCLTKKTKIHYKIIQTND